MLKNKLVYSIALVLVSLSLFGQNKISEMIQANETNFKSLELKTPLVKSDLRNIDGLIDENILNQKTLLSLDVSFNRDVIRSQSELLKMTIPLEGGTDFDLLLQKMEITSADFKIYESSNRDQPLNFTAGSYLSLIHI